MKRVIIIKERKADKLERSINSWLSENAHLAVKDVKYAIAPGTALSPIMFTAMIIYE